MVLDIEDVEILIVDTIVTERQFLGLRKLVRHSCLGKSAKQYSNKEVFQFVNT